MWKEYLLGVVTASLVCSIVTEILPDSAGKELLRILSGAVLATVILHPLSGIRLEDLRNGIPLETPSAQLCLAEGEAAATAAKKQYITQACEAYILSKAQEMGSEITPEITLDESAIPVSVRLKGTAEPDTREALARILTEDLGITKENQLWTGNPENSG